jgi:hypothetical protein
MIKLVKNIVAGESIVYNDAVVLVESITTTNNPEYLAFSINGYPVIMSKYLRIQMQSTEFKVVDLNEPFIAFK